MDDSRLDQLSGRVLDAIDEGTELILGRSLGRIPICNSQGIRQSFEFGLEGDDDLAELGSLLWVWKATDSLNADDRLAMAELLREAYSWIKMQKRADAKGIRDRDRVTAK